MVQIFPVGTQVQTRGETVLPESFDQLRIPAQNMDRRFQPVVRAGKHRRLVISDQHEQIPVRSFLLNKIRQKFQRPLQ